MECLRRLVEVRVEVSGIVVVEISGIAQLSSHGRVPPLKAVVTPDLNWLLTCPFYVDWS